MKPYKLLTLIVTFFVVITSITSCSKQDQEQMIHQAVAMESGDECHLCGMLITRFDGPKGEVFRKETGEQVFKFCSTLDLFSYYLDPENKRNVAQMFVHDMSKMPWGSDSIDDKYFIDAKTAWYVTGSEKMGAMGKTLASFSEQSDATAFAKEFGGQVISFEAITLEVLM
ncbi:MAG: nitrous oxide reductase accessory protein NosL [Colwellia sp.]|nr:nitrous oxide reductase accessory protein NosL [Colwellia sp.]